MRITVIGREGQVARALAETAAAQDVEAVFLGRPQLDLADPSGIEDVLLETGGDVIVNAAAYTAVDQAESEPELADAINGIGAGLVAGAAAAMNIPVVHLSTDYVFDGSHERPYREDDPVGPLGAYGRSKLLGEQAVAGATANHVILRTAWVYSPFGRNFVKTMLRLAVDRDEIRVVADQVGSPTSAHDIAEGILVICRTLLERPGDDSLRGVFHQAGSGFASWAELAAAALAFSDQLGGANARVSPIVTAEYLTPAKRPLSSRLDCSKLDRIYGLALPEWRASLGPCVERLVRGARADKPR